MVIWTGLIFLCIWSSGGASSDDGITTNVPLMPGVSELNCNSSLPKFRCDGSFCVSESSKCNGVLDCPAGQDESVRECGCLPNEFKCNNSCVDIVKRCDRKNDCPGGEDETDCKAFTCLPTHFKCNNFGCVPIDSVCNYVDDCGDGSDEIDCKYRACWNPEFRCNSGECIRPGFICDGRQDCKDGSDESDCGPDKFVRCGDGKLKHKYYWCDGWPDCPDNQADEINCGPCTGDRDFLCPNGRCISKANVCDSQCDCAATNGTECADEIDCSRFYDDNYGVTVCKLGVTLRCLASGPYKSNDRCIAAEYICDNDNNCHNGDFISDETGCYLQGYDPDSYRCWDNRTIPITLRCDYKYDCLHGDDEQDCPEPVKCMPGEFQCRSGQCIEVDGRCNMSFECLDKSDELDCQNVICPRGTTKCKFGGQCIPSSSECDFSIDCPGGTDESECEIEDCHPHEFKCDNGQCVDATHRCYLSGLAHQGCADNSHLKDCHNFHCSSEQAKCVRGPCLNMSLKCNGDIDCVDTWDDEDDCPFRCSVLAPQCECRDVQINCTNLGLTVFPEDAEKEITGLFELDLRTTSAANYLSNGRAKHEFTRSRDYTTFLQLYRFMAGNRLGRSLTNETFKSLGRMLYLDLSNNSLKHLIPDMFKSLFTLTVLNLQNNKIAVLGTNVFNGLANLKGLHLQGNNLEVLNPFAFTGLSSLPNLDLRAQKLRLIETDAFLGLRQLMTLDLSQNQLTYLNDGVFKGMTRLVYLDIRDNKIEVIGSNVFRPVNRLEKLFTDEFRFCCLAKEVSLCTPLQDEFSSCEDLMSNIVLRVCVWVLALIATVGNIVVIACRARYKHCNQKHKHWPSRDRQSFIEKKKIAEALGPQRLPIGISDPKVHSFLIINLALGDLLMGSYLLLIAVVDWYFRGVYSVHDSSWRSSQLCSLAGFISTFSSELSVFTLTVITLDRFLVIIFPFRVRRLEMNRTKKLMAFGWVLATIISAVPLIHVDYFKNFYGRSGVCLALHITPDKPNGWEYSVFVFLFLNLVSFTIIAVGYLWMFLVARTTQHAVHKERRTSESAMAWRMTLLVATDAACWVPIIILGFVSLAGFTVPPQVFAWVAVFVLPLNAAVNPVLYTLSTAPFITPARHGILTFRRSCKMSLSQDHRRTFTSNLNHYAGAGSIELYSMTRRSIRNSLDTSVTEQGVVLSLNHPK